MHAQKVCIIFLCIYISDALPPYPHICFQECHTWKESFQINSICFKAA